MSNFKEQMAQADHLYNVCEFRFRSFRKELLEQGWTDLEVLNLVMVSNNRETIIHSYQKTADAHCNGDIDAYLVFNKKYRQLDMERRTVYDHMIQVLHGRRKRVNKDLKSVYDAMEREYNDAKVKWMGLQKEWVEA